MNVTILSAGVWGTTLAAILGKKGHIVQVWEPVESVVNAIQSTGKHPRLPHLVLAPNLQFTSHMVQALAGSEVIVCVSPGEHVRATLRQVAAAGYAGQLVVLASKGIEQGTDDLLADVARQELGPSSEGRIGLLSGPTIAVEVSKGVPTAVTATAPTQELAEVIQDLFITPNFRVYTQTDLVGVEVASALKNVIAIACGINDGMGLGANSKAAFITRGLWEITHLGTALGAKAETFTGLAGIGDLVVTCTSADSRNRTFGELVGKGKPVAEALKQVGMVVEGYYTAQGAMELAAKLGVQMPITQAVWSILYQGVSPQQAVMRLMTSEAGGEGQG